MGFFYAKKDKEKKKTKTKQLPIETLNEFGCKVCPLNRADLYSPKMEPSGSEEPLVYILGEAPGKEEDKMDEQFVGKSGRVIRETLRKVWSDHRMGSSIVRTGGRRQKYYEKDGIRFNNTIRCHPPGNRNPTDPEMECCRVSIEEDILRTNPKVIIGAGNIPLTWVIGNGGISKWRGRVFPIKIQDKYFWYYPILHPSFVLRKQRKNKFGKFIRNEWDKVFDADLLHIVKLLEKDKLPQPVVEDSGYLDNIHYVTGKSEREYKRVVRWLDLLRKEETIAIDIETSSIRPYHKDSRILTVAIGTKDKTYSFPVDHPKGWEPELAAQIRENLKDFLLNSGVKIAHNLKFEQEWFLVYFGESVIHDTQWGDTQGLAYVLDERRGMLSLDDQCLVAFGFNLKNLTNLDMENLINEPLDEVLRYNGMDTKYTHKLYEVLMRQLKEQALEEPYHRIIETSGTLAIVQRNGLVPNWEAINEFKEEFTEKLERIIKKIKSNDAVKKFEAEQSRTFNPASNPDLVIMFRDILQRKEGYVEDGKKYKTDEEVLKQIDHPLAALILTFRGVTKLKSTYIDAMDTLVYEDGLIHTNYNLTFTATGRLSSTSPNTQNYPKRKNKEIRRVIGVPEGHWLVSCDYGQIEARVLGMASHDHAFCEALWNDYDIHMEWAKKIANAYPQIVGGKEFLDDPKALKKFRGAVKNQMVFPAFYGASMYSIAGYLNIPIDVIEPLFKEFWETFSGVKDWQNKLARFYDKHGYVQSLTGRLRRAPLNYNEILNSPIQSAASDIVITAMNRLIKKDYKIIMNIHDDISLVVKDEMLEESMDDIAKEMCLAPFDFINVPLTAEIGFGDNWADQEDYKVYSSADYGHTKRTSIIDIINGEN